MPFPINSTSIDNFNRANEGPPPSSSWTNFSGGLKVVSNACVGNATGSNQISYWNVENFGPDCEAFVTISSLPATDGDQVIVFGRIDTVGANGYDVAYNRAAGTDTLVIARVDAGVGTALNTLSQEVSAGDSIGIQIIGSTIYAWYKASAGSWELKGSSTDSTYSATGKLALGTNYASTSPNMDDFGGGAIKVVSVNAQTITSSLGTATPVNTQSASGQVITSNLGSAVPVNTKSVSAQSISSLLGNPSPVVLAIAQAQLVTPILPNIDLQEVRVEASAQSIISQLQAVSISLESVTTVVVDALVISSSVESITPLIAVDAPGQTVTSILTDSTPVSDSAVNATVIVDALVVSSIIPTHSTSSDATVSVGALTMSALLGDASIALAVEVSGQSVASLLGGVTPSIATDISAFQLTASLPDVSLSISGGTTTVTADALTLRVYLGTPTISGSEGERLRVTTKHNRVFQMAKVES